MTEKVYGVLGSGMSSKAAIEASLNDLKDMTTIVLPWYGSVPPGLEVVYDWALDNQITFDLVTSTSGKSAPKSLAAAASSVQESSDVDREIVSILSMVSGVALVMWDEDDEDESVAKASLAIDHKLVALELTNGLAPIVFDSGEAPESAIATEDDLLSEDDPTEEASPIDGFTRQEMEAMPVAAVKRHATQKGVDVKGMTKADIINSLYEEPVAEEVVEIPQQLSRAARPVAIILVLDNGASVTIHGDEKTIERVISVL